MRYRRPKNYREKLNAERGRYYIDNPCEYKGRWREELGGCDSLFLEVGMGKGRFLYEKAKRFPFRAFLGMERLEALLIQSCERAREEEISNIRFIGANAFDLMDYFEEGEVDGIYLNFSDPWKKSYQAKRRLTHIDYLNKYATVSKEGAILEFKTDNRTLFDFSLEQIKHSSYEITYLSYDLHSEPEKKDNILTEYEENFVKEGIPICKVECFLKK